VNAGGAKERQIKTMKNGVKQRLEKEKEGQSVTYYNF
jgi:hypothetical protein